MSGKWVYLYPDELAAAEKASGGKLRSSQGVLPSDVQEIVKRLRAQLSDLVELVDRMTGIGTGVTAEQRRAFYTSVLEEELMMLRLDPQVQHELDHGRQASGQRRPKF